MLFLFYVLLRQTFRNEDYHVAYHVDNFDEALVDWRTKGIRVLEDSLRPNKHDRRLIYLNPADTEGKH